MRGGRRGRRGAGAEGEEGAGEEEDDDVDYSLILSIHKFVLDFREQILNGSFPEPETGIKPLLGLSLLNPASTETP